MSNIAKHDYKNENINSKEGQTPAKPLYTDNDIYEEKLNLNLSLFQTTKKNATFKMSEDSLRRHINTKHQKEEPSCVCVHIKNAIFMVPKNNKIESIYFMRKKNTQWH